jgi:hypothetical protein
VQGNFYWNAALLDIGKMVHVQMFPTSILNGGSETVNLPTISFCGDEQKTRLCTNPLDMFLNLFFLRGVNLSIG